MKEEKKPCYSVVDLYNILHTLEGESLDISTRMELNQPMTQNDREYREKSLVIVDALIEKTYDLLDHTE